jgi:N-acetylmuramoyl-L-alanine amidase
MPTVEVFLDGVQVGTATYGLARPDVATVYAGAPDNVGFQYTLDTTRFANGSHSLSIKATDALGHYSTFGDTPIVIAN